MAIRKIDLEKFYTKPKIAEECCKHINFNEFDLVIEPSAGDGSFIPFLPKEKSAFYDIEPENDLIKKQDFLELELEIDKNDKKILFIGNPPFGRQSNLAIKFINHAAKFADTIAFILPISFKKESMISRLDKYLWLQEVIDLDKKSFYYKDEEFDIPCSFFIFKKLDKERPELKKYTTEDFEFVKKEEADYSIRRCGFHAGDIEDLNVSEESHYFIKDKNNAIKILKSLNYPDALNTAGPKSISKQEIIKEYERYKENPTFHN